MRPYYHEYAPMLQATGGVAGFHANFSTDDFFADATADLPALRAYLQGLIDQAAMQGRQPVLKFCRSLGRVSWMRHNFPQAIHIVLLRNPATQFDSGRRHYARHANAYFLAMPWVILARNRDCPQVADILRLFGVRLPDLSPVASQDDILRASLQWVAATGPEQWYLVFLAFWLLCVLRLPDCIDPVLDADRLFLLPRYRVQVRARLVAATGLPVTFGDDLRPPSLPDGIGAPPDAVWRAHQVAAMLMAARYGADWAHAPICEAIAAMLAHADLVATPEATDDAKAPTTPAAYIHRLHARATAREADLGAIQTTHAWRAITSAEWVVRCLRELAAS